MTWNFFAMGHGKGEVDGIGALLTWEVQKEQIKPQGKKLQNATEIAAHLQAKANKFHAIAPLSIRHINKYFHLVKVGDVDMSKPYDYQTMHKSHGMHQVRSISCKDPTLCQFRQLSCFCITSCSIPSLRI
jgi:hypothetical protein